MNLATNYHKNIGKWVLLALVALHIGAIAFYLWRKHNLVRPMLNGDKELSLAVPGSRDDALTRTVAVLVLALCAAFAAWLASLAA